MFCEMTSEAFAFSLFHVSIWSEVWLLFIFFAKENSQEVIT